MAIRVNALRVRPQASLLAIGALTATLAGCAMQAPNIGQNDADVNMKSIASEASRIKSAADTSAPGLNATAGSYVSDKTVRYIPQSGTVSLNAQDARLGDLIQQVCGKELSVSFVGSAVPSRHVTTQLHHATRDSALQQLAAAAGYAVVIQPNRGRVLIAPRATYVFRIPTAYLGRGSSSYDVGGNTAAGGSSSSSGGDMSGGGVSVGADGTAGGGMGGGMGGGSGGNQLTAAFHVSGSDSGVSAAELQHTLKDLAGKQSKVVLDRSSGLVSVTSDGAGLARVQGFLRSYSQAANTRVSVHAAILQVSLTGAFKAGIDWSKVISLSNNGTLSLIAPNGPPALALGQIAGAGAGGSSATSELSYTSQSVSAVIQALKQNTGVRIVSRPSLIAGNGTPATLFSGTQLPYVGSVSSNVSGLSGTATSGAGLSYVLNGLSLSFVPQVVGDGWVNMKLIPALSRVRRFDTFEVDGNKLQGPEQSLKQVYLQMLAPQNRTIILAGSRQTSGTNNSRETPLLSKIPVLGAAFKGLSRSKTTTQLVILLRTAIMPAPQINPLVSESL